MTHLVFEFSRWAKIIEEYNVYDPSTKDKQRTPYIDFGHKTNDRGQK